MVHHGQVVVLLFLDLTHGGRDGGFSVLCEGEMRQVSLGPCVLDVLSV